MNNKTLISKGDVYWVDLNKIPKINTHGQKGTRPCIVISNNTNNDYSDMIQIVPCTTKEDYLPQHTYVYLMHNIKSWVLPEQILSIEKKYLGEKCFYLSRKQFLQVEKAVQIQLGMWRNNGGN